MAFDCGEEPVERILTIILTTSPVRSNPSTDMIEKVLESLELVEDIQNCRIIFVFDGYKIRDDSKITSASCRSGIISNSMIPLYEQYIENIRILIQSQDKYSNSHMLILEERHGFGYAVKKGLELVDTEFVMVVQHDRTFQKPFSMYPLLKILCLSSDAQVNYIGFITTSTLNHVERLKSRLGSHGKPPDLSWAVPLNTNGVTLLPLLQWYDSTHVCRTDFYRDFVFGPNKLVKKGGFIEDKLGQQQLKDLKEHGESSFSVYGTYLMYHGDNEVTVAHLDGGDFHTEEQKQLKGWCRSKFKNDDEGSEV